MRGLALLLIAFAIAGCGDKSSKPVEIAIDVPLSRDAYIGKTIANGVRLAAGQLGTNRGDIVDYRVVTYDNAGSPSRSVANIRRAVARGVGAIVTDGTGVDAGWKIAERAHIPICIAYDGDEHLVNAKARPNVFRIAPTNHGMAFRFAEYLVPKRVKLAFLTDDTGYGRAGLASLNRAFAENPEAVVARIDIPSSASDLAPQVLKARRAGATGLMVWGRPETIAEAIVSARSSGWDVPFFAPPAAADPLVRQQLAGRPRWLDGLTFASSRLTAEGGPAPFLAFRSAYESSFGVLEVGVKGPGGRPVVQPPEFAMYAYDFTNLLATAITNIETTDPKRVLRALNEVSTRGANGDLRGFNVNNHEGVVDDDVYFARFRSMVFGPVPDDALSSTLPAIDQGP
jgi:ABC-type branched-subunit amino acid transport system substrate-binding protein